LNDIEEKLRALLLLALKGDNTAYAGFLTRSSVHLRAYFRRRLVSFPDDVEDLVQETLLALHNQRHTYRPSERLTPWLFAIARYKLVDSLRLHAPRRAVEIAIDDDMDDMALFEGETAAAEARRDLRKLLDTLPDRHRLPILQVKVEGKSVAEAALHLGMSESAVKIGIHRGLKLLARQARSVE
jgi:RNA polymerase sigma-70 factor (ECF subfamily)